MKNRILPFFSAFTAFLLFASAGYSQSVQLAIEGTAGNFHLAHTVVAKENWYSIGRLFNVSPHDVANYNNLSFDKPLDVNQQIKIPLTPSNFDQKQLKIPGESLIPIYHVVEDKEWMFKISSIYNDVPVTYLEKWNNIKRDDVRKGNTLIVGYLRVKTDQSPLVAGVASNPVAGPTADVTSNKAPVATGVAPQPVSASQNPAAGTGVAKPAVATASGNAPASSMPVSNASERVNNYALSHSNGGFFSTEFTSFGKSANGLAGTFKSTSGWTDGKYYALMNGISVGTIIRVSGSNGKAVYAKVLGQLPEMKESAGLLIRISNAASAELGLGEGKFPVEIKY